MVDFDHTLESSSAQEKPSYIINLIVQEIFASSPKGIGCLTLSFIPPQYDPCIILQGDWLREFGFERGDPIRVAAESNLLRVIPGYRFSEANTSAKVDVDGILSNVDFMEEVDGIKAERGDINGGQDHNRDDGKKDGSQYGGKESDKGCDQDVGKNTAKNDVKDGAKSEDFSDVLSGVKRELDYD